MGGGSLRAASGQGRFGGVMLRISDIRKQEKYDGITGSISSASVMMLGWRASSEGGPYKAPNQPMNNLSNG